MHRSSAVRQLCFRATMQFKQQAAVGLITDRDLCRSWCQGHLCKEAVIANALGTAVMQAWRRGR